MVEIKMPWVGENIPLWWRFVEREEIVLIRGDFLEKSPQITWQSLNSSHDVQVFVRCGSLGD
jgi:hypothetical protein